jgi:glycosyltransferase involved in cell wall biosynthesis
LEDPRTTSRIFTLVLDVWEPERGGLEFYAEQLLIALVQRGSACRLLCGELRAPAPKGVDVRVIGGRGPGFYRALDAEQAAPEELWMHFRHPGRPQGCREHVFLPLGGIFAAALDARRRAEAPLLRGLRRAARMLSPKTRCYLARERAYFAQDEGLVLASSEHTARELRARFPGFGGRVEVTGLPVDPVRFAIPSEAQRAAARAELGLEPEARMLLWLGHDPVRKGLGMARELAARLRADSLDAWLYCAGHGSQDFDAPAEHVVGLGQRSDVPVLLHAADLFVLPSLEDNLSFVVLEALASGLPVITSRHNGAASFLSTSELGGVLEDPRDVSAAHGFAVDLLREEQLSVPARQRRRAAVEPCFAEAHFDHVARLLMEAGQPSSLPDQM